MQTIQGEPYILKYYLQLTAYLNGSGNDPGNFRNVHPQRSLSPLTFNLTSSVPKAYRHLQTSLAAISGKYADLIENIIVHGSYGDFSVNHYSDLDLIVYLNQRVVENAKDRHRLKTIVRTQLVPLIYTVDPLQHHGVFLLWPSLANCYVQSILPAVVFLNAWSAKDSFLQLNTSSYQGPSKLDGLLQTISSEQHRCLNARSLFFTKRHLSHIMMVPCVYYGDRGRYLYKADSFAPFILQFPNMQKLFMTVSKIRQHWPAQPAIVRIIALHGMGYRLLGKYFAPICGLFYNRVGINRHLKTLSSATLKDLSDRHINEI